MTRKQSTKTIRLVVLTVVLIGSIIFLWTSDIHKTVLTSLEENEAKKVSQMPPIHQPVDSKEGDEDRGKSDKGTGDKGKENKKVDGNKDKPKEKPKDAQKGKSKDSKKQGKPKAPVYKNPVNGEGKGKETDKEKGAKNNEDNEGFNAFQYYQDSKKKPQKGSKKLKDSKNPNGFLGDTTEISPEDKDALSGLYDEVEEPKANDKPPLGAPGPNGFDIPDVPATIEDKDFANVPSFFTDKKIENLKFRIYSHNVKNGGHQDLVEGEEPWADRFHKITSSIKLNSMVNTVVTLQEVYRFQLDDIMADLNRFSPSDKPEWSFYGQGRIDGKDTGEFVPIIYKNDEWELVFSDTLWLNEKDPRTALEGWDAKYLRIVSMATLKHRNTGNYINIFNAHFDHVGEIARIGSAQLISKQMAQINEWPSFLMGDLNTPVTENAYTLLTDKLKDLSSLTTPFNHYGHSKSTITGFEGQYLANGGECIDYIFAPKYATKIDQKPNCNSKDESNASKYLSLKLHGFGLMHSKFDGLYMSDHRPLVADYVLSSKQC